MRFTVIMFVFLAASFASAESVLVNEAELGFGSGQLQWEPAKEVVVKWDQLPNTDGYGITSEVRVGSDFWTQSADDFFCEAGHPIVSIEWWGTDYTAAVSSFVVRFYSDVPGPPFSHPGDLLYEETIYTWTAVPAGSTAHTHYTADLPIAFEQVGGNVYWISIQAIHDNQSAQWFWLECLVDDYWNDEAVIRSDYFSLPDWTPLSTATGGTYYEVSFVLYADVTSPVDETSWASIKAMYR